MSLATERITDQLFALGAKIDQLRECLRGDISPSLRADLRAQLQSLERRWDYLICARERARAQYPAE